jgi:hypothetical protein
MMGHRGQYGKIDSGSRKAKQMQSDNSSSSNANNSGWNASTNFTSEQIGSFC